MLSSCRRATVGRRAFVPALAALLVLSASSSISAQIKAQVRPGAVPPWEKGIVPISSESYYHAIECGKRGGDDSACVFWDTGLCQNPDFALAFYTPYKQVAYEVWLAVRKKQPPPQPSYQAAQRARVTLAITPVKGSKNTLTDFALKRGEKVIAHVERQVSGGTGRFSYEPSALAPSGTITFEMKGSASTLTCSVPPTVLRSFR